jgi:hypothetical protein
MCVHRSTAPRPRWALLYLLAVGVTAAAVAVMAVAGPARVVLAVAVWTAGAIGGFRWVAANRVALDQLDWCGCASSTMRVIASDPHEDGAPAEVEDDRFVTLVR